MAALHIVGVNHKLERGNETESVSFRITDCNDLAEAYSLAFAEFQGIGQAGGALYQNGSKSLRVLSYTISGSPGRVYEGSVEFANQQSDSATRVVSGEIVGEFMDVWRAGSTLELQGGNPSPTLDISGTKIDSGGEPMSVGVRKANITILNIRNGSLDTSAIWSNLGKRNSVSFEGFDAGTLLFTGARLNPAGRNRYEFQFNFVYDQFMHMKQRPLREQDGKIRLNTDKQAAFVSFYQPFPGTDSFSSLVTGTNPYNDS